jgi:hypothetical protein
MINDGEWMYTWTGKKGTKMNIKRMEKMDNDFEELDIEENTSEWEDVIDEWEEDDVDYDCNEQKIDKDLFIPPSDVVFEDMGAMMDASMKMNEDFQKMGEQFSSGEEMDIEDMQKMIDEMNFGN